MKTTNKLFRIFFLIICVFGLSKTCCWGQSKYSQYNYEPKVRTFIFTYGLILSENGYPSHLTDYRHSLKFEFYGLLGTMNATWKRESKDNAKAEGRKTYLYPHFNMINGIRYNFKTENDDFAKLSLNFLTLKLYLCFTKHPRIMTNLSFSIEMPLTKEKSYGLPLEQNFLFYYANRCALGVGIMAYFVNIEKHTDCYPAANILLHFDL